MPSGYHRDIEAGDYHASEGVSVSRLRRFAKAPAKALAPGPKTRPLALGSLLHCAILEPDALPRRYVVTDLDRAGTKAWEALERDNPGRTVIKRPEMDEALRIRDAVFRHPTAAELLAPGGRDIEGSFYWTDPELGIQRRGRADIIRHDMRVLVDLKSTESAHPRDFGHSARTYGYDWQDPYYRDGIEATLGWRAEAFVFIALEKEPPYLAGTYELLPEDVEAGAQAVRETLARYAACERSGIWPGYSASLEYLPLPKRRRSPEPGETA